MPLSRRDLFLVSRAGFSSDRLGYAGRCIDSHFIVCIVFEILVGGAVLERADHRIGRVAAFTNNGIQPCGAVRGDTPLTLKNSVVGWRRGISGSGEIGRRFLRRLSPVRNRCGSLWGRIVLAPSRPRQFWDRISTARRFRSLFAFVFRKPFGIIIHWPSCVLGRS